ncbi:hypothetical protein L1987_34294 [Smallanthus sonchifolius]|uniref:Uncharacterized protein n=1 Tax=Smallanthus sonchifolius TaxID=185202 RepID=A0ACB9HUN3_9ASTR|nr:hypothetical protein L1987_34294 [Smallanthus sonchifolius]
MRVCGNTGNPKKPTRTEAREKTLATLLQSSTFTLSLSLVPPSHWFINSAWHDCSLCAMRTTMESDVPMNCIKLLRYIPVTNGLGSCRTFAAGSKAKKGKGGAAADAPKQSTLSKEVKSTTVVGANILKDGTDPKILPDSEYPEWLWHLLDKKPALSELRRKNIETLPYEDLKRFVKLDNRARIKENNTTRAKN